MRLPARADVLVVGGGLTGCAAACYLARGGAEVVLVERAELNTGASGNNAGSIHAQIPHEPFVSKGEGWARRFACTIPLMMDAIALWSELPAELSEDLEVSTAGGLLVATDEADMRAVAAKAAIERAAGLPVELLGREDVRRLAPYLSDRVVGGAFCALEGKANPLAATPAFARAATRAGARLLQRTEVRAIRMDGAAGFEVDTSSGVMSARRIVNGAGAEAGAIAAMVGLDLPIERHPIQVAVTAPAPPLVPHLLYAASARLSLKQTSRGAYLVGGGWPSRLDRTGRLTIDPGSLRDNLAVAIDLVPALAEADLVRAWPAIVNGTDDWMPILGEARRVPGFYLAIFPWMGFTAGPLVARLVADLVLGRPTGRDLSGFSADAYG